MKYTVIDPINGAKAHFKTHDAAMSYAKALSKIYHKGVEIQRTPAYKCKQMVIVI